VPAVPACPPSPSPPPPPRKSTTLAENFRCRESAFSDAFLIPITSNCVIACFCPTRRGMYNDPWLSRLVS
jgi:hypothetical protein